MLAPTQIIQTLPQIAAVILVTVPRAKIQEVMGPAIQETIAAARADGIGPIGPVFAHHFGMTPGLFRFEVGVPVSSLVTPVGRVIASELPAAKVARTVYTGPYEGLGDAWCEFLESLKADGLQLAPNLWERFLTDPTKTADPVQYQTELNRPLL